MQSPAHSQQQQLDHVPPYHIASAHYHIWLWLDGQISSPVESCQKLRMREDNHILQVTNQYCLVTSDLY
jgi:hypothetical protein